MRKISTFLLSAILAFSLCACSPSGGAASDDVSQTKPSAAPISFRPDADYTVLMARAAAAGDLNAVALAAAARNAKIEALALDESPVSADEFMESFKEYAGFDLERNYLDDMVSCCISSDAALGMALSKERNAKISVLGLAESRIDFDDLYLLATVIYSEAGSDWLSMEWKMMIGEVLLNRVASPEFPDSVRACAYQEGQYYGSSAGRFQHLVPNEASARAAARLLSGERVLNDPSVVFQSNHPLGSETVVKLYDSILGYTYLCRSNYPGLYAEKGGAKP